MEWCRQLGSVERHTLWLMPAKGIDPEPYLALARASFGTVNHLPDAYGISCDWNDESVKQRDAGGPNSMIRQFATHFGFNKLGPWMFIEPDAIPLKREWADAIEREYLACGKRFMGALVTTTKIPHSTGNMVWPENAWTMEKLMLKTFATINGRRLETAFDIACAADILRDYHDTKLIQQVFRGPPFESREQMAAVIRPEAVVFHSDKTGSIPKLLRQKDTVEISWPLLPSPTKAPPFAISRDETEAAITALLNGDDLKLAGEPRVYTYYAHVPDMNPPGQLQMIEKWKENWLRNGWDPVVLGPKDHAFEPKFATFPTVNPKLYEQACFSRWQAMADTGGFMTDFDVHSYGFTPADLPKSDKLRLFCGHVPCAVLGTKEQFSAMVKRFLELPPASDHWSDMYALATIPGEFDTGNECAEYGTPGWHLAKLVHYSHHACNGTPRSEVIPKAEEERRLLLSKETTQTMPEGTQIRHTTWIAGVREQCQWLAKEGSASTWRRALVLTEMRKAGLLTAPKRKFRDQMTVLREGKKRAKASK